MAEVLFPIDLRFKPGEGGGSYVERAGQHRISYRSLSPGRNHYAPSHAIMQDERHVSLSTLTFLPHFRT